MPGQPSYNLTNQIRDLSGVLSNIFATTSNFLRWFPISGTATNRKHEWLEEYVKPKTIAYSAATNAGVFTVTSTAGWEVGDYVHIEGDTAVLKVTAKDTTTLTTSFVAANGSSYTSSTIPVAAGVLCYDSHPIGEGSESGPSGFEQSGTDYNTTQIFRTEAIITGTTLSTGVYGAENTIAYQIERRLWRLTTEMNRVAMFGTRQIRAEGADGLAGGLYFFGTQDGGLSVAANGAALSQKLLNDAAQLVTDKGATPSLILCSPAMCRVISSFSGTQISIQQNENSRGAYVSRIVNDVTGQIMNVHAEPDMPKNDIWVMDPAGFATVPMAGRSIYSKDVTSKKFDGVQHSILGEYTFQFKNAKNRLCRISGLQAPETTLANGVYDTVNIGNTVNAEITNTTPIETTVTGTVTTTAATDSTP